MNRTARRALAVAAASAAIAVGTATPAFAGQGDVESTCPSSDVCMWEDNSFGGNKWVEQSTYDGKVYDIDWWNGDNEISSIRNNSGFWICVYPGDYTWGGGYIKVGPHTEYSNLAQSFGFDNEAESFKVVSSTSNCN
ncbi:MAG: peptidase inhibitor family I36 protein [Hamadaea sp.]|uniref:peptidase inhibitor family I36 protein n=1 Tax=Hamadaea sp. TaxID=2024425 RepID=UPI00184686BE|nr:peptidase inhibitor family I36 protein [Hamadaea sp.]NUR70860.1 peptidase inhibitor family I36 protein [Hamadaea sp.]NUT20885.1 peptidase inhibitor family I36 protein [Hamadaea sp.]